MGKETLELACKPVTKRAIEKMIAGRLKVYKIHLRDGRTIILRRW